MGRQDLLRKACWRGSFKSAPNLLPKPAIVLRPRWEYAHQEHGGSNYNVSRAVWKEGRPVSGSICFIVCPHRGPVCPSGCQFLHLQASCRPWACRCSIWDRNLPAPEVSGYIPAKLLRIEKPDARTGTSLYQISLAANNTQLEPYFSRIKFTKEQKKHWFHDREGLLFGFGVGFYIFLRIPLLGVLIYGIAEASTAYLITKITDPPPPPMQSEGFAASQQQWTNKHEFLNLKLVQLDAQQAPPQPAPSTGSQTPSHASSTGVLSSAPYDDPPPPYTETRSR
jgi:hypothetical protein